MNAPARIVIDPEICHGRPIIEGTRMRVVDVLEMLADEMTMEEILEEFPYVTREGILACLAYAARVTNHGALIAAE